MVTKMLLIVFVGACSGAVACVLIELLYDRRWWNICYEAHPDLYQHRWTLWLGLRRMRIDFRRDVLGRRGKL